MPLIQFTDKGLYCPPAGVYIDPWKPVAKAVITHGHSDHARWGMGSYLAHHDTVPILRLRLGNEINVQGVNYGEPITINGVKISLHPAGHILGSAQVRVEYEGEIWVISGDYKLAPDGVSVPFEPVKCHHFVTESTFGLPVFRFQPHPVVINEMNEWWRKNKQEGKTSVLTAYALGKAQNIIKNIDTTIGKIFVHGAVYNVNETLKQNGLQLPETYLVTNEIPKAEFAGAMVIATPSSLGSPWMKRFPNYSTGVASGWMALRGARRRQAADRGFVFSDHADWEELNTAIKETGAENIYVTHGYSAVFSQWLREQGYNAVPVETQFEGEQAESKAEEGGTA